MVPRLHTVTVSMASITSPQLHVERLNALTLVVAWIQCVYRRLICMLTGHRTVLHFEPRRLALRCVECGYETPGWIIGDLPRQQVHTRENFSTGDRAA